MAIEVKLIGMPFGVAPIEDGNKQILVRHDAADTIYLLPLDKEAQARLIQELGMDNEHLQALIAEQGAATNGAAQSPSFARAAPDG